MSEDVILDAHGKVELFRCVVDLPDGSSEGLWARLVGPALGSIDNTPWYVYGLSYGDHVLVEPDEDRLVVGAVVKKSGYSTLRIKTPTANASNNATYLELREWLPSIGCSYEGADDEQHLLAIDVPPGVDWALLKARLDKGEAEGAWTWEEGDRPGFVFGRPGGKRFLPVLALPTAPPRRR